MIDQRKYVIQGFLIFAIFFVGVYLFQNIFSNKVSGTKQSSTNNQLIDFPDNTMKIINDGKTLFFVKCASCHSVMKHLAGPALGGVTERGPWIDSIKLYTYIRNPEKFKDDKYVIGLSKEFGANHMGFPDLTNDQIRSILNYLKEYQRPVSMFIDGLGFND